MLICTSGNRRDWFLSGLSSSAHGGWVQSGATRLDSALNSALSSMRGRGRGTHSTPARRNPTRVGRQDNTNRDAATPGSPSLSVAAAPSAVQPESSSILPRKPLSAVNKPITVTSPLPSRSTAPSRNSVKAALNSSSGSIKCTPRGPKFMVHESESESDEPIPLRSQKRPLLVSDDEEDQPTDIEEALADTRKDDERKNKKKASKGKQISRAELEERLKEANSRAQMFNDVGIKNLPKH